MGALLDNRFEILGVIGRGTLGTVYQARDTNINKIVAIKIVHKVSDDVKLLKRFERGMKAAASLNHPNVAIIYEYGFFDAASPYYVMDYLDGILLEDEIARRGFLPLDVALSIAMQICDAIDHSHTMGVIHRNLKPANIMLVSNPSGSQAVKVLDFGFSKSYYRSEDDDDDMDVTSPGELLGTPEFMSPEQCSSQPVDWRSDIYAMGCLLYAMLAGRPPMRGASSYETINLQMTASPLPFIQSCPSAEIPLEVQRVIFRALNKRPDERQQTMAILKSQFAVASRGADVSFEIDTNQESDPIGHSAPQHQTIPMQLEPGSITLTAPKSAPETLNLATGHTVITSFAAPMGLAITPRSGEHPRHQPLTPSPSPSPVFSLPDKPAETVMQKAVELCQRQPSVQAVFLTRITEGASSDSPDYLVVIQLSAPMAVPLRELLGERLERAVFSNYKHGAIRILFTGDGPELAKVRSKAHFLFAR